MHNYLKNKCVVLSYHTNQAASSSYFNRQMDNFCVALGSTDRGIRPTIQFTGFSMIHVLPFRNRIASQTVFSRRL